MPYREDLEVLRARQAELERELSTLEAKEEELRSLRANASDLRNELREVRARLEPWAADGASSGAKARGLEVDDLRIASPCSASWDDMVGDEKRRFCDDCGQSVYNASALSRVELEELLGAHAYQLCLRMYRREDGTVMTSDCPVGKRRVRLRQVAAVACGGVLAGVAVAIGAHELRKPKLEDLYTVHTEGQAPRHHLAESAESVLYRDPPRDVSPPPPAVDAPPADVRVPPNERHHTLGVLAPRSRGRAASCDSPRKRDGI